MGRDFLLTHGDNHVPLIASLAIIINLDFLNYTAWGRHPANEAEYRTS